MKKTLALAVVALLAGGGYAAYRWSTDSQAAATDRTDAGGGGRARGGRGGGNFGGGGGFGGGGFPGGGGGGGGGPRLPMTVELAPVQRANMAQEITVVGNLIGLATVEATPKVQGRLETVAVRLGDRVTRGQRLAKLDDGEIREQVKQAEASYDVGAATIRQREADLKFARTNLDRSLNLFERQLIPKQTNDDAEARYQAATAQVDLAKAQFAQAQARLDELKINLANTVITSPVNGFIGKRALDPGAWVTPNSAFLSVVDISVVRLVVNVVESDLRRIDVGLKADAVVDAFPGEHFVGRIGRVAPVLDPATRTAQIEVEIDNARSRLKPGMYAKVAFTVERHDNALTVPAAAVVDQDGRKGVFVPGEEGDVARFQAVELGIVEQDRVEIAAGLVEGARIVTTGAAALRDGDRILLPGQNAEGGARGRGGRGGRGGAGPSGGRAPTEGRTGRR